MRIGILGGTFDPIHMGHLILAQEACERLKLAKVIFIPCHTPPHKEASQAADPEDRYRMVVLATQTNPSFDISRIEIERGGTSYSVETLTGLKERLGEATDLFFIVGSDSLGELISWKDINEIFKLANFIVAERPGYPIKDLPEGAEVMPITSFEISSSGIRQRIRQAGSIRYLVPDSVREYIIQKNLYR